MTIPNNNKSGGIQLGCLFIIITIALLWNGGQHLYVALTNRQPTVMSYSDWVKNKPQTTWIRLTSCSLSLAHAAYSSPKGGDVNEVYIPVRGQSAEDEKMTYVLLSSRDPEMINMVKQLSSAKSESDVLKLMLKNSKI